MAQQQQQRDVPQYQLCPPNKRFKLIDENKKYDLVNPYCPNEILAYLKGRKIKVPVQVFTRKMAQFFRHNLGFNFPLRSPSNFMSVGLLRSWQTLCKIFTPCLTTKATGHDQPPVQIMQILYCFINNVHVDYAEILLKGLHYSFMHPTNLIPYPMFTKIIIDYCMTENPDISHRVHDNYHKVKNDDLIKNIFNSRKNKDGANMKIHDWMLTEAIKLTNHYRIESSAQRMSTIIKLRVPPRRQDPKTPIPTAIEIDNVAKVNEHLEDEELDQILKATNNVDVDAFMDDVINSQEDPGIRIDLESYKENPEEKGQGHMGRSREGLGTVQVRWGCTGMAGEENVAKVNEHLEDEELDQILKAANNVDVDAFMDDVINSQEDPGIRIDLESYKENPEVEKDVDMMTTTDDVEEESDRDEFKLKE
nr:hypothetical protein [Tanacetum cinerariifolium]